MDNAVPVSCCANKSDFSLSSTSASTDSPGVVNVRVGVCIDCVVRTGITVASGVS